MTQSYYSKADIRNIMVLVKDKKMGVSEATTRMVTNARKPLKQD